MTDFDHHTTMDRGPGTGDAIQEEARTAGRLLLWIVIALCLVALAIGVLLLGPLGLVIVVPAVLAIWAAVGVTAGGPAAGA